MSKSEKPDGYALKKVGKVWLLGKPGKQDFKVCPFLTHAKEVNTSENFIIADENVYEIKEVEHEEILLVKVEEIKVCDQQKIKTQSNKSLFRYDRETNYDRGESLIQYNAEETHFDTENDVIKVTDESELEQMHDKYSSLEEAGQTEDTSLIDNKVTDELEQMHDEYSSLEEAGGRTEDTRLIDNEAISGVPEEISVQQYAKATFDYSRKTSDEPTTLKEIHFIDKKSNIVKKIQDAFYSVFVKGEKPDCDTSKFVKSRRHGKGHSPGSYTGAQASFSSSVHKDSLNAQTQFATSDVFEVTQTEPLSFFDYESSAYAYLLHGKEEYKLHLSRGDLLKVKASAVVIPVDDRGNRGNIAGSLFSRIPDIYRKDYTYKLSSECHRKKECDVFITQGYECDYPFIVHAIYPAYAKNKDISQRKHDVQKLYKNVFSLCDTKTGIRGVVAPLLGPDIRSATDIRACAEMFLQSYLDYYSRPVTKKSLLVNLVCREELVYDRVKSVFDEYVMSKKAELNKTQEDMDISPSTPPVEKQDNHGEENCVICMDTITEPETLKCGHMFCKDCIQQQFQFKEACPTCGQVCGVITGDQPAGEMRYAVDRYTDCSGYNGHGRIAITYNFPSGRQGPEHPSPGTFYKGITRVAYLPNNDEGRKILAMLEVAFKRKLVFTIGNSRTTGQEGVITWNDIHHKTNPRPHQQFGYPDPGYLERVKDELAVKGVTEKDIPKTISR